MFFIIGFVVINCLIAIFFERKKLHVASIVHALLFVVLLLVLLCTTCASYVKAVVDCAFDVYSNTLINGQFIHCNTVIGPCFMLEIIVLLALFLVCAITVVQAVECLLKGSAKQQQKIHHTKNIHCRVITSADEVFHTKIYIRNCSYIC